MSRYALDETMVNLFFSSKCELIIYEIFLRDLFEITINKTYIPPIIDIINIDNSRSMSKILISNTDNSVVLEIMFAIGK